MNLAKLEHARESGRLIREAFLLEMRRDGIIKHAVEKHGYGAGGAHGAWISGPFKEHWPEKVKDEIRDLNRRYNALTDRALAAYRKSGLRSHYGAWKAAVLGQTGGHRLSPALYARYQRIARGEEPSDISRGQSQLAREYSRHLAGRHENGGNPRTTKGRVTYRSDKRGHSALLWEKGKVVNVIHGAKDHSMEDVRKAALKSWPGAVHVDEKTKRRIDQVLGRGGR